MANLKPSVPMMSGGDYIYPVTTIDQILLEDGTRASAKNPIVDIIYPIGSVITMSTNANPATLYGGTWELIDKEFEVSIMNGLESSATLNANCSAAAIKCRRVAHTLEFFIDVTPAVTLTDSALTMFTLDLEAVGVSSLGATRSLVWFSDGGNAIMTCTLNADGVFTINDVIVRGSSTPSLDAETNLSMGGGHACFIPPEDMLDSACNKFYFKRTA